MDKDLQTIYRTILKQRAKPYYWKSWWVLPFAFYIRFIVKVYRSLTLFVLLFFLAFLSIFLMSASDEFEIDSLILFLLLLLLSPFLICIQCQIRRTNPSFRHECRRKRYRELPKELIPGLYDMVLHQASIMGLSKKRIRIWSTTDEKTGIKVVETFRCVNLVMTRGFIVSLAHNRPTFLALIAHEFGHIIQRDTSLYSDLKTFYSSASRVFMTLLFALWVLNILFTLASDNPERSINIIIHAAVCLGALRYINRELIPALRRSEVLADMASIAYADGEALKRFIESAARQYVPKDPDQPHLPPERRLEVLEIILQSEGDPQRLKNMSRLLERQYLSWDLDSAWKYRSESSIYAYIPIIGIIILFFITCLLTVAGISTMFQNMLAEAVVTFSVASLTLHWGYAISIKIPNRRVRSSLGVCLILSSLMTLALTITLRSLPDTELTRANFYVLLFCVASLVSATVFHSYRLIVSPCNTTSFEQWYNKSIFTHFIIFCRIVYRRVRPVFEIISEIGVFKAIGTIIILYHCMIFPIVSIYLLTEGNYFGSGCAFTAGAFFYYWGFIVSEGIHYKRTRIILGGLLAFMGSLMLFMISILGYAFVSFATLSDVSRLQIMAALFTSISSGAIYVWHGIHLINPERFPVGLHIFQNRRKK